MPYISGLVLVRSRAMPYVLIVDDDPEQCDVLSRFLTRQGFTTACASNGQDALARLGERVPAAVILDYRMPQMTGITLLEIMRSYLRWSTIPVILASAYASETELSRATQFGNCTIFQKPLDLARLLHRLHEVIPLPLAPRPEAD